MTTTRRACLSDCGSDAIARSSSAAYGAKLSEIEPSCRAWWDASCMALTPKPTPSCGIYRPVCVDGHCKAAHGPGPATR
ncbi:hypothetical protein AKJ09_02323 [Labilithrix luteola]|uniref:Uncharacterized protein n=1 Tax=Labilithrix luteola TaxID=1391654 RepID=A0A0K1PRC0_9BACT|nr:hypothetical protein [Labilithrix luteola]AKU95659.1 hypothetical protein AKJ09_02323 [Labilithrix luteola]